MKRFVKPLILLVMVGILLTLIFIPVKVYSDVSIKQGVIRTQNGLPACYCPFDNLKCYCIIRDFEPN